MPDEVRLDRAGAVAVVTLDRPEVHNALNASVLAQLTDAVASVQNDRLARAIVITGAGEKTFCAGADLDELTGLGTEEATQVLRRGQQVMADVAASRVPVIAAVNGTALGGGFELVLASTFAVVSERASFGLPESGLGLIPGYGGTQRLPRAIGRAAAAHLMLTGERLSAARAHELGLTPLAPVAPDALMPTAMAVAARIATKGPEATAAILACLATSAVTADDLERETIAAGHVTSSREAADGIAAFKERRAPRFADGPDAS